MVRANYIGWLAACCLAVLTATASGQAPAKSEQAREWFGEIWRAAKYARIAITSTGDLARLDAEEARARRQFSSALNLPLPDDGRATCAAAAKAVVDFIAAAKVGNMQAGPASYERQKLRWDGLSEECRKAVLEFGRKESAAAGAR